MLEHLGLDPYKVAADLAIASPVLGSGMAAGADVGAFAGRLADPTLEGVSGSRPKRHSLRLKRVQGIDPDQIELINLLASFLDFRVVVRDIAVLDGPELGLRIAVIWVYAPKILLRPRPG